MHAFIIQSCSDYFLQQFTMKQSQSLFKQSIKKKITPLSSDDPPLSFPPLFQLPADPIQTHPESIKTALKNQQACWLVNQQEGRAFQQSAQPLESIMSEDSLVSIFKLTTLFAQPHTASYALRYLAILPLQISNQFLSQLKQSLVSSSITLRAQACTVLLQLYEGGFLTPTDQVIPLMLNVIDQLSLANKNESALKLIVSEDSNCKLINFQEQIRSRKWSPREYQKIVRKLMKEGLDLQNANFQHLPFFFVQNLLYILAPLTPSFMDLDRIQLYLRLLQDKQLRVVAVDRLTQIGRHVTLHYRFGLKVEKSIKYLQFDQDLLSWELIVLIGLLQEITIESHTAKTMMMISSPNLVQSVPTLVLPSPPSWMPASYLAYKVIELFLTERVYQLEEDPLYEWVEQRLDRVDQLELSFEMVEKLIKQFLGGEGLSCFCILFYKLFFITSHQNYIFQQIFYRYATLMCYSIKRARGRVDWICGWREGLDQLVAMVKDEQGEYREWVLKVAQWNESGTV